MEKDFEFFMKNINTFYEQYGPSFIAVKGERVIGVYESLERAVVETSKSHKIGTFLVQQCVENPETLVAHFSGIIQ